MMKIDKRILNEKGIEASEELAKRINDWCNLMHIINFSNERSIKVKSITYEIEYEKEIYYARKFVEGR